MNKQIKPYADLKVKVREYEGLDGKVKGAYVKIGTLFASPHFTHMFINIEALPLNIALWDGSVSVFKRTDATQSTDDSNNDVDLG